MALRALIDLSEQHITALAHLVRQGDIDLDDVRAEWTRRVRAGLNPDTGGPLDPTTSKTPRSASQASSSARKE